MDKTSGSKDTQIATVKYCVATYSGTIQVHCDANDDNEMIVAKAKQQLRTKAGSLPFGYQSFKIVKREEI